MLFKACIDIDIDLENITTKNMRSTIVESMLKAIEQNPELILLTPIDYNYDWQTHHCNNKRKILFDQVPQQER